MLLQRYKTITDCILFLIKHKKMVHIMHLLSSCINTYQHTKLIPTFATEVYVSFFLSVPVKCMSMSSPVKCMSISSPVKCMSGSFHLCQWRVYQFFPPVPVKCICQFLLTCASEVYDTIQKDFYNQFHCCVWFSKFVSGVDMQVSELSKSLSCLSDNRSGRCGHVSDLSNICRTYISTELHIYWLNP